MDIRRFNPSIQVSKYMYGINKYSKPEFSGGNISSDSIYDFVNTYSYPVSSSANSGGTLSIAGQSLGSYDYVVKNSSQTVSSFSSSDWFTSTEDSSSSFIFVNGNLTIDSGQTFIPSVRKLFTVLYVNGDLTVNGTISMTGRGANHSATGSNISASEIRIANGTYSGVTNPNVPASGGSGAVSATSTSGSVLGNNGTNGVNGATGGGGSGGVRNNNAVGTSISGAGADGTCFSGGSGGGGVWSNGGATAGSGSSNGGAGGNGVIVAGSNNPTAFGGAGNPLGTASGTYSSEFFAANGTGGILIIICSGSLNGNGTISCNGIQGSYYTGSGTLGTSGGGGSGGGSLTIMAYNNSSTTTMSAAGGLGGLGNGECASGTCPGRAGGSGGNGTSRFLTLV